MIDKVFPEFKELVPQASTKTLRSHMTSGWFISLGALLERKEPPFNLFSIDRCFRREQQEDASRLMTYYSASCVIMDEDVIVDHGKAVAEGLLTHLALKNSFSGLMRSAANTMFLTPRPSICLSSETCRL